MGTKIGVERHLTFDEPLSLWTLANENAVSQ
jgi:hypothetical protein